jgi:O-antigen/teichoic acid export membrane protein
LLEGSIRQRVLKGFGANAFGQVTAVIINLAGVPIFLHYWGAQLYGEWLILFAIPAYLSMTDLGFSQAAANDMTASVARGHRAEALGVFQSVGVLVVAVAGTGLLIVSTLIALVPPDRWFSFETMSSLDVRWVLWLLVAETLVRMAEGQSHAGFRAVGQYAFHVSIYHFTSLLQHTVMWCMAITGFGPVAAALSYLTVRVIVTPTVGVLLVKRHTWLRFGVGRASTAELRRLARPALGNIVSPLAQAFSIQGVLLVVAAAQGPLAAVVFSSLRTLTRSALQLVLAVSHAAEPEFAGSYGGSTTSHHQGFYQQVLRAGFWLALGASLILASLGGWILEIWTHGKIAMDRGLFFALLVSAVLTSLWYPALGILKAVNQHLGVTLIYALVAGGSVALAALLVRATGELSSVGVALVIADALLVVVMTRIAAAKIGGRVRASLRSTLNPLPLLRLMR